MNETPTGAAPPTSPPPPPPGRMRRVLLAEAPYLAMLAAVFFGIAQAALAKEPDPLYWMIVTPLFGVLCIAAGWAGAPGRGGRARLIWTQALHWGAFLIAMRVLFRPEVQAALGARGTEIGLLILLALGTFVAGVHAGSARIVGIGVVLGAAVPPLALVQHAALLTLAAAALAGAAGAVFVMLAMRGRG